jgi:hypothetical protein
MSKGSVTRLPERLSSAGATEFERRLIGAASREQPSRELSERMAGTIGVAPPFPVVERVAPEPATLAPEAAVGGLRGLVPWISGAVVVVGAGAILAGSTLNDAPPPSPASTFVSASPPSLAVPTPSSARLDAPAPPLEVPSIPAPQGPVQRSRASAAVDLRDQIALIDAARAAVAEGSGARALALMRQYQSKYGSGSFGPEAAALRIEALVKLGRTAEARSLAARFVSEQRGSPLAERVARVAGLAKN